MCLYVCVWGGAGQRKPVLFFVITACVLYSYCSLYTNSTSAISKTGESARARLTHNHVNEMCDFCMNSFYCYAYSDTISASYAINVHVYTGCANL